MTKRFQTKAQPIKINARHNKILTIKRIMINSYFIVDYFSLLQFTNLWCVNNIDRSFLPNFWPEVNSFLQLSIKSHFQCSRSNFHSFFIRWRQPGKFIIKKWIIISQLKMETYCVCERELDISREDVKKDNFRKNKLKNSNLKYPLQKTSLTWFYGFL